MKNTLKLLIILLIFSGTYACKKGNNDNLLPPISGKPGEVVIVIDDNLYDGFVGDTIVMALTQEEIALPQSGMQGAEPMFDLVPIPPVSFTNVFKSHRNIIIVRLNEELEQAAIKVEHNYWAFQQVLIRLEAPTKAELAELIYNKEDFLISTLRETELDRLVYLNKKFENSELHRSMLANHKIITHFPKGFDARVDTGNFVWIQHDPMDMIQGLFIWDYPYTGESQTSYEELVVKQDKMLKTRVPGANKGSYMALEFQVPVYSRTFENNGHFVRELKGLWTMEGDWMGGPFISWTFVDEARNRIVTAFGFVYAPKYEKRNHIRKVESLLKTIDFPD